MIWWFSGAWFWAVMWFPDFGCFKVWILGFGAGGFSASLAAFGFACGWFVVLQFVWVNLWVVWHNSAGIGWRTR